MNTRIAASQRWHPVPHVLHANPPASFPRVVKICKRLLGIVSRARRVSVAASSICNFFVSEIDGQGKYYNKDLYIDNPFSTSTYRINPSHIHYRSYNSKDPKVCIINHIHCIIYYHMIISVAIGMYFYLKMTLKELDVVSCSRLG